MRHSDCERPSPLQAKKWLKITGGPFGPLGSQVAQLILQLTGIRVPAADVHQFTRYGAFLLENPRGGTLLRTLPRGTSHRRHG